MASVALDMLSKFRFGCRATTGNRGRARNPDGLSPPGLRGRLRSMLEATWVIRPHFFIASAKKGLPQVCTSGQETRRSNSGQLNKNPDGLSLTRLRGRLPSDARDAAGDPCLLFRLPVQKKGCLACVRPYTSTFPVRLAQSEEVCHARLPTPSDRATR